jgi:glycosyltransferase involved in cell wall biosynthesis
MACATPVVGSDRGGIPEVLGDAGVTVDPDDTTAFSDALSDLLGRVDYRTSLGRKAYLRCREMFDWDIIAENWACLIGASNG